MPDPRTATLAPFVARLHARWAAEDRQCRHRRLDGSLVFADISGFTALTERLARRGKVGAEEMSEALNAVFSDVLQAAAHEGADLVKWGGDAVLLFVEGPGHATRACRAAHGLRARLRAFGPIETQSGSVRLRMSVGVHSGKVDFYLIGDEHHHLEMLASGPAVSRCVRLEAMAEAGQIAVSHETLQSVGARHGGHAVGELGQLLRRCPAPVADLSTEPAVQAVEGLLPPEIRDHLLRGLSVPEHREIAVAFVKFSGTDALGEAEGPEAVADALHEVVTNVSLVTAAHGVTFFETDIDVDGGKVMLAAGVPASAGNDAERMLRACRAILDGAGRLPLRIGVNVGHVFAGDFGPAFRRTYSIKGDAVNLAARVMAKAPHGRLWATTPVLDQSATDFETQELAPFAAKGKSALVRAHDVGAILGTHVRELGSADLVGREDEMAVLAEATKAMLDGRGTVVRLLGEAGIGKSRLMAEVSRLVGPDVPAPRVQCLEYEASTPYYAFRVLLRAVLGLDSRFGPERNREKLEGRVSEVAARLLPLLPLLGEMLGVPLEENDVTRGLDEEFRRRRLEDAAVDLLGALLPGPTLLLVDDAHFMDSASALLLDRVLERVPAAPWLVLFARRDAETGWHPEASGEVTTLEPKPLTVDDAVVLLRSTRLLPLPRTQAEFLAARGAGNPLFLQTLAAESERTEGVEDLPLTITELFTARLDRLPPEHKTVLRHAAVLGERFRTEYLNGLFDRPPDRRTMAELGEFLVPEGPRAFRFRHSLVREVAYDSLPFKLRASLHARLADLIESGYGADAGSLPLLSLHNAAAGRHHDGWQFSVAAARQAEAKFALREAADLYARAIDVERIAGRELVPPPEVARVLTDLGWCRFCCGDNAAAESAFRRARRLLKGEPVSTAAVAVKEALVDQRRRRFPQSLRRLRLAMGGLEGSADREALALRSRLSMVYATGRWRQGRVEDALAWGERAVEEAEQAGDPEILARALGSLHTVLVSTGRADPAGHGVHALRLYEDLGNLHGQAHCLNNLAVAATGDNRWSEAVTMFGRAAALFRTVGDTDHEANSTCNQAEVLVDQGRCEEALPLLADAVESAAAAGDDSLTGYALRLTGTALSRSGRHEEALEQLLRARSLFLSIDEPAEVVAVDLTRAESLLLQEEHTDALALVEEVLLRSDLEALERANALWIRGFALVGKGRQSEAAAVLQSGLALAAEAESRYLAGLCALGLVRAQELDTIDETVQQALRDLGVVSLPVPRTLLGPALADLSLRESSPERP